MATANSNNLKKFCLDVIKSAEENDISFSVDVNGEQDPCLYIWHDWENEGTITISDEDTFGDNEFLDKLKEYVNEK